MPSMHSSGGRSSRLLAVAFASLLIVGALGAFTILQTPDGLRFEISFPPERSAEAQDGRIVLIVSSRDGAEPRSQYRIYDPGTQPGFGIDVEGLRPGDVAVVDGSTFGFPVPSLDDLPPGDYRVQAVLNRYTRRFFPQNLPSDNV